MSNLKCTMLAGACALATGIAGLAGPADAATIKAYGGGSSLISVYMQQAFNCFGNTPPVARTLLKRNFTDPGPPANPTLAPVADFNYTGTKAPTQDCSTSQINTKAELHYMSASSGVGVAGVFSHDPSYNSAVPDGAGGFNGYGDIDPATPGEQDMPYISFGMSDAGISTTQVGFWNAGNDQSGPGTPSTSAVNGVTVVAPGETAVAGVSYPNPLQTRGAMVQFPISVDPVAFAYDPTYKKVLQSDGTTVKSYHFYIRFPHSNGSGGLRLDQNAYCKIWNGQITNWNDPALKVLNNNKSLQDPQDVADNGVGGWNSTGVPLQIAGRADSSGTTSIFYRHLAKVCGTDGINLSGNQFITSTTTLPVSTRGGTFDGTTATGVVLGKFTLATGSGNVAKYVAFRAVPTTIGQVLTQGNIAYLGADFVAPYNSVNGNNTFNLNSADLKNQSGNFEPADGTHAGIAFGVIQPPQSLANGHYDSSSCSGPTSRCRAHPADWVEPVATSSLLAAPAAAKAYPVVGTTNIIAYSCYADKRVATLMNQFLAWYDLKPTVQEVPDGLLTKNGLAALPGPWRIAIGETFTADHIGLGLNIQATGTGKCAGKVGG